MATKLNRQATTPLIYSGIDSLMEKSGKQHLSCLNKSNDDTNIAMLVAIATPAMPQNLDKTMLSTMFIEIEISPFMRGFQYLGMRRKPSP